MSHSDLEQAIDKAWKNASSITPDTKGEVRDAVAAALDLMDSGNARVAEKVGTGWRVNQWLKKAVLLSFRLNDMEPMPGQAGSPYWDKVPLKSMNWDANRFRQAGFRSVPGSVVRHSAFIASGVILMPSFVNLGAYVDSGTLQADPVIIEDNCFIGARSEVAEGVIIETGAVLAMGCYIGQSTKIIDRDSGEIHMGRVPASSVVVPGSMASKKGGPNLYCCVIVKTVDEQTRAKTSINDLLRD